MSWVWQSVSGDDEFRVVFMLGAGQLQHPRLLITLFLHDTERWQALNIAT